MAIILDQIEVGQMQNYAYFLGDPQTKNVALIDPAWDTQKLLKHAHENNYIIKALIITHAHPDHTNGIPSLLKTLQVPVYIFENEKDFYKPIAYCLKTLKDESIINIDNLKIKILHTPGHTPGSICLYTDGILITGDTLFIDEIGRCDLPGGNLDTLIQSLRLKIHPLPDDTKVYPGHNYHQKTWDTLKNQKTTNYYLRTCANF